MRWINRKPRREVSFLLAFLSFAILIIAYQLASNARLAVNPSDKLMPSIPDILETGRRLMTEPDKRTGTILFWSDTKASLTRLFLGLGIASLLGLLFGILVGMIPYVRAAFSPLIKVFSVIPPLALLPILFIAFGLGELSKVLLVVVGILPFIIRDLIARVDDIPEEQLVKAQTLGANSFVVGTQVVLPQIMPRLVGAIRLSLGPAWLFLIAAEAVAAEAGLGYRIFLVRRYLAMDVILNYVAWISLLAYLTDVLLRATAKKFWPWQEVKA